MDIFRTLLCLGLFALIWNFRIRGSQPLRDFVAWGMLYPFHFVLMVLMILVIWGAIGSDFGLQGLFLEDNALTQILLGAAVMLLFSALILHYSVFDPPDYWWKTSLKSLISVLRDPNRVISSGSPLQHLLNNGFLERLDRADMVAIAGSIERGPGDDATKSPEADAVRRELDELLNQEPLRLLVSPAVLLAKGFMLVFLVGVVTSILIPILNRQPVEIAERLPWLVGVILGQLLGIVLACQTTRWVYVAAGWQPIADRALVLIQQLGASNAREADAREAVELRPRESRPWMNLLLAFFLIHLVVNVVLPDRVTSGWIDWPEKTYITVPSDGVAPARRPDRWEGIPRLPIQILLAEVVGAVSVIGLLKMLARSGSLQGIWTVPSTIAKSSISLGQHVFGSFSHRRWRWTFAAGLILFACVAIAAPSVVSPIPADSLWRGLWGFVFLGLVFLLWIGGFWLASRANSPANGRSRAIPIAAILALVFLVLSYLSGIDHRVAAFLALVAVVGGLLQLIDASSTIAGTRIRARDGVIGAVVLCWVVSLVAGWRVSDFASPAALWLGVAVLTLGAVATIGIGRNRSTLLYPLTLIGAFIAFAIPYNTLPEPWQASIPAGGSIACVVGLIASIYTIIAFFRPKSAFLVGGVVAGALLLINGNAWFVDPNEFKTTFPNMESYYALPIYLDTRDYFRETTPSLVRLRNQDVTNDFDRLKKQNESERLATAFVRLVDSSTDPGSGYRVRLEVQDPRGRLRAGVGSEVRLAAEEWYDIKKEGADCIAVVEEGLNRKIFRWLRYSKLHMVRNGIVRGSEHRLEPIWEPPVETSGEDLPITYYETNSRSGSPLGIRLLGLKNTFAEAQAKYILMSMYWPGKVASVKHEANLDTYTIDLDIPPGGQPLSPSELGVLGNWLERCHLDTVRPSMGFQPSQVTDAEHWDSTKIPKVPRGDCLVLEDGQEEAPIPVGLYLGDTDLDPAKYPQFAEYWPTRKNLATTVEELLPKEKSGQRAALEHNKL